MRLQYTPLTRDPPWIRLFYAEQSLHSHLAFRVIDVPLNTQLQYDVISYTWGDPTVTEDIFLNAQAHSIPRNLAVALRRICKTPTDQLEPQGERYFWTDTICIDQLHNAEKSFQLTLVSDILQNARQTIMWPGVPSQWDGFKPRFLETICRAADDLSRTPRGLILEALEKFRLLMKSCAQDEVQFLEDLLDQRLFKAAWTLPDIVHLNRLIIMAGSSFTSEWQDLAVLFQALLVYDFPVKIQSKHIKLVLKGWQMWRDRVAKHSIQYVECLELLRDLQSTNERDKLFIGYATMVKSDPVAHTLLQAQDYRKTLLELLLDSAPIIEAYCVTQGLPYASLSLASNKTYLSTDGAMTLPSFCPDFRTKYQVYRLNSVRSMFSASSMADDNGQDPPEIFRHTLYFVKGIVTDRLKNILGYLPPRSWSDKYNVTDNNAIHMVEWFEWLKENQFTGTENYHESQLLIQFAETIQARGCSLWKMFREHNPDYSILGPEEVWYGPIKGLYHDLKSQREQKLGASLSDDDFFMHWAHSWLTFLFEEGHEETEAIRQFHAGCFPAYGRRFAITHSGRMCLVPQEAKQNDLVCVLRGGKIPFVFRRNSEGYENIGEAYVHGIMFGEALEGMANPEWEMFKLFRYQSI